MKSTHCETDVLIVGGGTSGVAAAIAAADEGASVVLMEGGSGIGGIGTHAGIHAYYMGVQAGLQLELDRRTREFAELFGAKAKGFHPDAKKLAIMEMIGERSIVLHLEAVAAAVIREGGRVTGAVFETPTGSVTVHAAITVDCTANGDVCSMAGVPYTEGREWDGAMHCYSMPPRYVGRDDTRLEFRNFDAGWVDSSSSEDVSKAMIAGRKLLGCLKELEDGECLAIASQIGAREGRHIRGRYTLQMEDMLLDRRFDDVVMRCFSHYDNHARDMANESRFGQLWVGMMNKWSQKFGGDVPYRCFLPESTDGLLIGCRALSMDRDVHTGLRMQRDMHLVGEVAGTAAAMCCSAGIQPGALEAGELQRRLIRRGVLDEQDLTRESAPWVVLGEDKRESRVWTPSFARSPEGRARLVAALGTDDEGAALWWLWQSGAEAVPVLEQAYADAEGNRRRGIAMALALLGSGLGVPELAASVFRGDRDVLPGHADRTPPRWIACLLALKDLKEPVCAAALLDRFDADDDPVRLPDYARILYILHYLIEVADGLDEKTRTAAIAKVSELSRRTDIGSSWGALHGHPVSIRWSVELTAAYLLHLLGKPSESVIRGYERHERVFLRTAAKKLEERLRGRNPSEATEAGLTGGNKQ
ncbi:MAG: hypothetical protein K0Q59_4671 [Paenibacillus sp.]|nr:hypothetical protein [Paenibacillus sp.]